MTNQKNPIPIFPSAIDGITPPAGMSHIGAYHGYATTIGHTDPDTGEITHNVIIMAGSVADLRDYCKALVPQHEFKEQSVARATLVGTDFVNMVDGDDEL